MEEKLFKYIQDTMEKVAGKRGVAYDTDFVKDLGLNSFDIMNVVSANGLSILSINANNNTNLETIVKLKVLTTGSADLEKMIVNMKKIKAIHNIERENL